ncbi:MAG TPA: hypothetical protein VIX60_03185 [Candidatus Cybelea sp.]
MWFKDFPEDDPDSNYPAPTAEQHKLMKVAEAILERLKFSLECLTVPQQREIIGKLVGAVYRQERPAGDEQTESTEIKVPAHESEGQALTEASQTDD